MRTFIADNPRLISKYQNQFEKKLQVKLAFHGKHVIIKGKEIWIYLALRVLEALDAHFSLSVAFLLTEEDFLLEHVNIKDVSRRGNLQDVRARVIGRKGRTLELIGELSDSYLAMNGNIVSVIAPADRMVIILHALEALIKGSKQSSVYAYLEKKHKRNFEERIDLKNM